MDISIIIPAYNEELFILRTLTSIKKWMPKKFSYEIILVDHGSTDRTVQIAISEKIIIIDGANAKTIAALRNIGVSRSSGNFLFFIDADVSFSDKWSANIGKVVSSIETHPYQICGSHPQAPENISLFIKNWFNPKSREASPNYIGACHLIISRDLFSTLGGFPEKMETSEEFTLCNIAKKRNIAIKAYSELLVIHEGTPRTIIDFIKSEAWHGRGDWSSISNILSSKISIITLVFVILHAILLLQIYFQSYKLIILVFVAILTLCIFSSFLKFAKHGMQSFFINTITFYCYFMGRSISLFSFFFNKNPKKRSRPTH